MTGAAWATGLVTLLGIGVVFGTDAFCALVMRPALARVDEASLTSVMGNVHRYGDVRMPAPGVAGLVGSAVVAVLAALADRGSAAVLAGIALVLLVVWLVLYARISAPINRRLTAAADRGETPADARALQAGWDRIIVLRAALQGAALLSVAAALVLL
ncbi:DUF1772 domain-containing protein [Curtobacterium sp. VKM Ac-2887]|uniref:DUF1772 domain-containing protein n=1 Tax=Curtobacterium sp. VKM Ac-2887 TaxID=2783819 RepID=UPI002B26AA7A|nr:DUF1772 domain-containing protein [Curtobacterium sp. VKM Ac-2887]